nr:unnamed protein product [Digitaria exilis]
MSSPAAPVQAAPPRPVRFGILGCADIARKVSRALLMLPPGVAAVAAVGSRSEEKARRFVAETGLPAARTHGSYESLLCDPGVEAVYLPLPTSLHVPWAMAASARGKHLLLEKPTALCAADLDAILAACDASGVQFMDTTMWIHNPRTAKMREIIADKDTFGDVRVNDIRVKPDLDALGVLGDIGWYCIRSILWAVDYELPQAVIAQRHPVKNQAGVLLACGATLYWADGKTATFNCSFLTNLAFDVSIYGTNGTIHVTDLVIPYEEKSGEFNVASKSNFVKPTIGWDPLPRKHVGFTDLPQEALMV